MNELNTRPKQKNLAAFITVAVCGALMIAAIVISILNPQGSGNMPGFDQHGRTHYNDMVYERNPAGRSGSGERTRPPRRDGRS